MHQFLWELIFIFAYYFSTQGDAAIQTYTMTPKYILMQYFADVLHLFRIPGEVKRNKKKKKKREKKREKMLPIVWSSHSLKS